MTNLGRDGHLVVAREGVGTVVHDAFVVVTHAVVRHRGAVVLVEVVFVI